MVKKISSYAVMLFIALSFFTVNTASAAKLGGYVGVFGGYTFGSYATWKWEEPYRGDFDLNNQDTWAIGAKIGYTGYYSYQKYLSFEFEYSYFNPDIDRTVLHGHGTDYTAVEGDVEFHNFMFNLIVKYPEGRIHPYIGGGIGFSYADTSADTTASSGGVAYKRTISDDATSFAGQVLAGVDIDLTSDFSIDVGYRYFYTEHDMSDTKLEFNTSMVTLGLKYKF
jgi:opacity protein-like surface antigen